MPIYEFKCRGCGHSFEALVRPPSTSAPTCPSCQGQDLEQLLSAFAVSSEERSKSAFKGAKKDNEKTLRDQRIAQHEEEMHHHH